MIITSLQRTLITITLLCASTAHAHVGDDLDENDCHFGLKKQWLGLKFWGQKEQIWHCHSAECAQYSKEDGTPTELSETAKIPRSFLCEISILSRKAAETADKGNELVEAIAKAGLPTLFYLLILSCFIGAIVGAKKDLWWTGLFFGLLGPIGWCIVIAMQGNRTQCPHCDESILKNAKRCKFCSKNLKHIPFRKRISGGVAQ